MTTNTIEARARRAAENYFRRSLSVWSNEEVSDIRKAVDTLTAIITAEMAGMVRRALETLPKDALGLDSQGGWSYRDELIANIVTKPLFPRPLLVIRLRAHWQRCGRSIQSSSTDRLLSWTDKAGTALRLSCRTVSIAREIRFGKPQP